MDIFTPSQTCICLGIPGALPAVQKLNNTGSTPTISHGYKDNNEPGMELTPLSSRANTARPAKSFLSPGGRSLYQNTLVAYCDGSGGSIYQTPFQGAGRDGTPFQGQCGDRPPFQKLATPLVHHRDYTLRRTETGKRAYL